MIEELDLDFRSDDVRLHPSVQHLQVKCMDGYLLTMTCIKIHTHPNNTKIYNNNTNASSSKEMLV